LVYVLIALSIVAGGVFGGLLLGGLGVLSMPWVGLGLMTDGISTVAGRQHAFPHWPQRA
jgi:predicted MFS family arabinose efflux permease